MRTRGRALNRILVLLALCTLGVLTGGTAAQAEVVSNETTTARLFAVYGTGHDQQLA